MKTLEQVCIDRNLFDTDTVFLAKKSTLFDCLSAPVPHYTRALLKRIETNLRALMCWRCTVSVVAGLKVSSFAVDEEAIHVISKRDQHAWASLIRKGYDFAEWTPECPRTRGRNDSVFAPPGNFDCVLVAEEYGTQAGAKFNSFLKFRRFLAVVFAIASKRAATPYAKTAALPINFCLQFPQATATDDAITRTESHPLMPSVGPHITFGSAEINELKDWYARRSRCKPNEMNRIDKGAHFLNRAINADDIEAYLNYFVSLDALFGRRKEVETSIIDGVRDVGFDSSYLEKTRWLFELRSEIVHGGSRYVAEWSKYSRYTQHFRTEPTNDVREISEIALLRAPLLFAQ